MATGHVHAEMKREELERRHFSRVQEQADVELVATIIRTKGGGAGSIYMTSQTKHVYTIRI